ncbi:hypothetical protein EVA_13967 [gut metagenome]|uniref:Uncharacterized protein n=1 Tax=gut metagenome TaxID=749906 RepID=J9FTT9_9ZZZZ
MKSINTCHCTQYSQLIPAIIAWCEAIPGETLHITLSDRQAFKDLKEFLGEQNTGFREIYDGERLILQFTK